MSAVLSSGMTDLSPCPLCLELTSTSVCANCAIESALLGTEPPDPGASREEVLAWAEEHAITALGATKS